MRFSASLRITNSVRYHALGGPLKMKPGEIDLVLAGGARRAVELGYGDAADLDRIESGGRIDGADPNVVSPQAKGRGHDQLGTIGSGNHFVEIDVIETVYDDEEAARLGLARDAVVLQIHTGSRGLGHQVATDSIRRMMQAPPPPGIRVADPQLACAPIRSPEGEAYLAAMAAAANFAFANRQIITGGIRRAWQDPVDIVYDVAHNIAKVEEHDGRRLDLGDV